MQMAGQIWMESRMQSLWGRRASLALGLGLLLCLAWGCKKSADKTDSPAGQAKVSLTGEALLKAPWEQVEAAARGQEVRWFFWSGNPTINRYLDEYVIPEADKRYGIKVKRVPVADPALAINRLLGEKKAGKEDGRIDMVWINGENFRTGKESRLFYGPFADQLPQMKHVDTEDPSIKLDFGVPQEGLESPWSRAQFVMIYDSAKVKEPPRSVAALTKFVQANPGRFTYAAPPDFTGSVFLRHVLYETAGGYDTFKGDFSENVWSKAQAPLFSTLKSWKPHLWSKGQTYPESSSRLHQLYGQGEIWMSMSYGPETASNKVRDGQFPSTTKTYLFDAGSIANTSFVAIPWNSPNKAASMVLANFLLSPEAQLHKQDPKVWGAMTVLDPKRLDQASQDKLAGMGQGTATLSLDDLRTKALPEIHPDWAERLEKDWLKEIAREAQ